MEIEKILVDFIKRRNIKKSKLRKSDHKPLYYNDVVYTFYSFKAKDVSSVGRGQWIDHQGIVFIGCNKCGEVCAIPGQPHRISEDGEVTPSLICDECKWHVFARLVGWNTLKKGGQHEL